MLGFASNRSASMAFTSVVILEVRLETTLGGRLDHFIQPAERIVEANLTRCVLAVLLPVQRLVQGQSMIRPVRCRGRTEMIAPVDAPTVAFLLFIDDQVHRAPG